MAIVMISALMQFVRLILFSLILSFAYIFCNKICITIYKCKFDSTVKNYTFTEYQFKENE